MSEMYMALLGILLLLAIFDLIVGVSNDAANFLNSGVGCRVAKRSTLLAVAAVGIVLGASVSGGMMEIARSGVFMPAQFSFHEVMILFLAVMLTDVILLDLFNTFGLPTSTTVSLIFELLGSAIAVALFVMNRGGEDVAGNLGAYINSAKALGIISGIFCSVVVAFTCGAVVMWISRLLFSFHYMKAYHYVGAIWSALALTAITYFAVFKGLKSSTIISKETLMLLDAHIATATAAAFAFWVVLCAVLQYGLKVNTLKLTVFAGTGALALAFAGNDLVNFIGVFMAAESSYHIASDFVAQGGSLETLKMGGLAEPVHANAYYLIGSGLIMVGALFFSKKARTVTETEVKLAGHNSGKERFGSCLTARLAVRYTINASRFICRITPAPIARFVGERFRPLEEDESGAAFDLVRASVNLTVSALLISLATSLKLPLSTTYVTFMVAMGSSLADRAWGRDSAVYRITGVFTVIGGWFMTGIAACTAAFISASVMMYGGMWGVALMILVAGFVLVKSSVLHGRRSREKAEVLDLSRTETLREIGETSANRLGRSLGIYKATIQALLREDRDALKRLRRKAREMNRAVTAEKENMVLPSLHGLSAALAPQGQILFRINESSIALSESLLGIVKASFKHIDNNHVGLNEAQAADLMEMGRRLDSLFPNLCKMLEESRFDNIDQLISQGDDLSAEFADAITRHLVRASDDESNTRTAILYLNLLNETRVMLRKAFTLLKEQRELFES